MNTTTRRHPRTLQEACGPHASSYITEPTRPFDSGDKAVMWACLVLAVVGTVWCLV